MNELGARFSPKATKSKTYSSVYGCNSFALNDPTVRFHYFPKPGQTITIENAFSNLKKRDIRKVLKMETIAKSPVVCSLH